MTLFGRKITLHYNDVTMGAIASQITRFTIVYSTVDSDADQRENQSSASLAFVRRIHRGPVNSPHKWPVTRKMFPFDDVIMENVRVRGVESTLHQTLPWNIGIQMSPDAGWPNLIPLSIDLGRNFWSAYEINLNEFTHVIFMISCALSFKCDCDM